MSISLQTIQQLTQQHPELAETAFDVQDYAQKLCEQLKKAFNDKIRECKILNQPSTKQNQIRLSEEPYVALVVESVDAADIWPLIQIWGNSATLVWQIHDLELTQATMLQRQVADIILRDLPLRGDLGVMLQTAAQAIGELLNASVTSIYLKPDSSTAHQKIE